MKDEKEKKSANPVRYFSKKYGGYYSLRYYSPLTGKLTHVPIKKSGRFASAKDAMDWAHRHLQTILGEELRLLERENWRSNTTILRHFNEYSVHRKDELPRSARADLSMLKNFGLPFFLVQIKEGDPAKWGLHNEELLRWLRHDARTTKNKKLSISSCNKVVNSLNHFLYWMNFKNIIHNNDLRPFEGFDARLQFRRGAKDLLGDEIFQQLYTFLQQRNPLYADCWYIQYRLGTRIMEHLGLPFTSLSDECPLYIKSEFEEKGFTVYGSIYLESQPANPYIRRVDGIIERAPLKWRKEIGPDYARTIPIVCPHAWNILVGRHQIQCELWEKQEHGPVKDSYLLFDGAQRHKYNAIMNEAYSALGLKSQGTHIARHDLSTEWTALRVPQKMIEIILGHKEAAHKTYTHIVGRVNMERLKSSRVKTLTKIVVK